MSNLNPVPLYQQIKEDIKSAIQCRKYKPKEKIPAEPELSAEYSVSRITIRRAIEELCNEGYLVKKQGRGTFVSTPRIHRKIAGSRLQRFSNTCREEGVVPGSKVLNRQIVPMREDEKTFFKLPEDSLLIYIQRLRTADGLPIFLENMFLPYEKFRLLLTESMEDTSFFETIQSICGRKIKDTERRTLEISRATLDQARLLSVPVGEPLFYMNCYFVDENDEPLCIGRQYYVGSRYMFEL